MKNVLQVELPFDDGGFTQSFDRLLALAKANRKAKTRRRSHSPDLTGVNLDLPLNYEMIFGPEYDWDETVDDDPTNKEEVLDKKLPKQVQEADGRKGRPSVFEKVLTPNVFAHLSDKGRNTEFSDRFDINDVCKIAARLLYSELSTLFNSRGNAQVKEKILDWIFAEKYYFDEAPQIKPMRLIPFTAAFCCEVEEIDFDDLCEVIHMSLDSIRNIETIRPPINLEPIYANNGITESLFALH